MPLLLFFSGFAIHFTDFVCFTTDNMYEINN